MLITTRKFVHIFSIMAILAMLFSSIQPIAGQAQSDDGIKREVNAESGRVSFVGPAYGRSVSAAKALGTSIRPQDPAMALAQRFAPEFGLQNPERNLSEMKSEHSPDGRWTVRYQQKYQGIPVMGGELIVSTNEQGDLYSMNGEVSPGLSLSTRPTIDIVQARETALQAVAKWYEKNANDFTTTEPELWFYDESLLQSSTRPVELVWRMEVTPLDTGMPVRELVLVDAQRGNISLHFNQIDTAWTSTKQADIIPTATPQPTATPLPTEPVEPTVTPLSTETETLSAPEAENTIVETQDHTPLDVFSGTTRYVTTTGSSSGSCTLADPCNSIQFAINASTNGDSIKIADGTYYHTNINVNPNVVVLSKDVLLSGGWQNNFTSQTGASIIDGQNQNNGLLVTAAGEAAVERFVIQNSTSSDSGAIYQVGGNFTLRNSTLKNNIATNRGAGIFVAAGGTLTVVNSTISNNSATTSGGGIYVSSGFATINNSTIAYNSSSNIGGGVARESGIVSIQNSILAKNTAATNGVDCSGTINTSDHNILGNITGCTVSSGTGDKFNVDPLLVSTLSGTLPLHSLQAASPAIDAGDINTCLTSDQRGMSRPQGSTCDMGAYEYATQGGLNVVSGSGQSSALNSPFALPLTVFVYDTAMNPVVGVTVAFTAPASGASGVFANSGTNSTTAITNASGYATTSIFTSNNQTGSYSIIATVSGISGTASFNLNNGNLWYVATTGSDANSCLSASLPCATIDGAIGKASTGETIRIAAGTYTGIYQYIIQIINKDVTLLGGWNSTFTLQNGVSILDGQNIRPAIRTFGSANVTLSQFVIQNGYQSIGLVGAIEAGGTSLTIKNTTIKDNTYSAIYLASGQLTLINSTVTNNSTSNDGAGIRVYCTNCTLEIQYSTIANNIAGRNGGGIYVQRSSYSGSEPVVYLRNSILAGNSTTGAAAASGQDCLGKINIVDHSIIGKQTACTVVANTSGQLDINPQISTYAIGSPAYHALLPSSPAIDSGEPSTCPVTDLRGMQRPQGSACDMGAYEYKAPQSQSSFAIIKGANQRVAPNLAFPQPFVVSVVDSVGSAVSGATVTFTAPASGVSGTFANGMNTTTVTTDGGGIAQASVFTANNQVGSYNVTASVSGLPGLVNFTLINAAWFVSPSNGSDSFTCDNPVAPCLTITKALEKAQDGDTVLLTASTFTGSDSNGVISIQKPVTLLGGWNNTFTSQNGFTIIDGQHARRGIYITSSPVNLSRFIIENGYTVEDGGGIYGSFNLKDCIIRNNQAKNGGGIRGGGSVTNCSIYNNSALYTDFNDGDGGGIDASYSAVTITNSTIFNNTSSTWGGGVSIGSYSVINNSTIVYNQSGRGGGMNVTSPRNGITVRNSIIAHNISTANDGTDCFGDIENFYNNIITNSWRCTFTNSSGNSSADPLLFPVPVGKPEYFPLLPDSPVIGKGDPGTCAATDQRGITRPQGAICDIGSFEFRGTGTVPASILAYSGTPQHLPHGTMAQSTLKAFVTDVAGDAVANVTVTFTAPASGASVTFTDTHTNTTSALTDSNGIATATTMSSNNIDGTYTVTAAAGLIDSADFLLVNGLQVQTYALNNSSILPGILLCNQTEPNCTNGSDPQADAAHKFAIGSYYFYSTKFNRYSFDNNDMAIVSSVHYCHPYFGCSYQNAFWDGEQIVYGDGRGYPLADDTVAHEYTHGVTQYESNLFYYYQAGAINESLSDVWGEYYDQWNGQGTDTTALKWRLGEDIGGLTNPAPYPTLGLRDMKDPTLFHDPDKMSSPYYYKAADDNGGVHYNSGVNNKAAFLMVDGGSFNSKTVTSLGWEKTAAIYYEANTKLLTSGSDYSDLYYALQQACTNLIGQHGITSADCTEVKDAIDAVEMNSQPTANFNTDAPLCTAAGTVPSFTFVDDLENGTGNWSFNNGNYTRWQYDSPYGAYAQSGGHFLYADDYPQYQNDVTDATAQLTSFVVPSGAYLHFAQAFDFEQSNANYDGGVIEYSTNGGGTWTDAGAKIDFNGYTGQIYPNYINPLKGRSAFIGSSHGYISTRLNLASLAGQTVSFRWRMGLDDDTSAWGWWVDNVKIYNCIPDPAPANDNFSNAKAVSAVPYNEAIDTTAATEKIDDPQVNSSCDGKMLAKGQKTVWYKYLAPRTSSVFFDTFGSNYNTYIAVWTGTSPGNLALVGCDDDAGNSLQSQVSFYAQTGITYYVEVAGYSGIQGGATESNAGGSLKLHATTFADVPGNHVFWRYIEGFYTRGITTGCSANPFSYCPDAPVNRAAMAVFILRAKYGSSHVPDPIQTHIFSDLPIAGQEWMQPWIEEFYEEGVTTGCGVSPLIYCPQSEVTREAMAVFLLRAKYGAGYTPPPASNPPLFADVPVAGKEWMQPWIEEFYRQGYTTGCGASPLIYCPGATVNRAAMAVFISRIFNIPQAP